MDDGLLPERERELLVNRDFVEVEHEDQDEACMRTMELMRQGVQTILRGVLMHGHWIAHPDLLERVEGVSGLGNYYYVACDIKRDRHMQDVYKFQGAFYAEVLARVQGTKPVQGYVMSPDGTVQEYFLDEVESDFRWTLEEIEKILAGQKPPHFLTSGCKQSPWFSTCRGDSMECDDLSLINRVWRSEVEALKHGGIQTVHQLSVADPDLLAAKIPTITRDRFHHLRMQATALAEGRTIVLQSVPFPPAQVELYFDIESSPVRDLEFLFGVLMVDHGREEYKAFVAKKPEEEETAFRAWLTFLEDYPEAPIYHFGWYEIEVMKRLGEKYGLLETVEQVIKRQMHDVLIMIRDAVLFPLHFYSLKDIAKLLGFTWRGKEASGVNAVVWYEHYLKTRRKAKLQDIIDYNEDDCRATYVVKKWVAEKAGE